jgi:hypothetical protein
MTLYIRPAARHAIDDVALAQPDAIAAFEANPFPGIWSINKSAEVGGRLPLLRFSA